MVWEVVLVSFGAGRGGRGFILRREEDLSPRLSLEATSQSHLVRSLAGDVEIGLQERNGQLEVDIIQARGLTAKPGSKTLPGVGCPPPARRGGGRGACLERYLGEEERKWSPTVEGSFVPAPVTHKGLLVIQGSFWGPSRDCWLTLSASPAGLSSWRAWTIFPVYDYTPVPGRVLGTQGVIRKHLYSEWVAMNV